MVSIPAGTIPLTQPLLVSPSEDKPVTITGVGRQSILQTSNGDGIVVLPQACRFADPTGYFPANALNPAKVAFRSNTTAGIRWHSTILDKGKAGWQWWKNCRTFTIEVHITRHVEAGGICGLAWATSTGDHVRPAPFYIQGRGDIPGIIGVRIGTVRDATCLHQFQIGLASETPFWLRLRVNLDTGSVICERDGIAVAAQSGTNTIQPGDTLAENPGGSILARWDFNPARG